MNKRSLPLFLMLLLGLGSASLLKAQDEAIHFLDDFESGTLTHWTVIDGDNDGTTWRNYAFDDYDHVARSVSRKKESTSDFLVSPLLEDVTRMSFRACSSESAVDYFRVMVSSTDPTPGAFTTVYADDVDGNWTIYDVTLPTDTKYVAIYHYYYGPYDDALYIDDVAIYGTPNNHIYTVNIEGYTAPRWGAHPDFEVSVPANAHCSVSDVVWKKDTPSTTITLSANDMFNEEEAQYYMGVYLTPDPGYTFVDYTRVFFNDSPDPFDFVYSCVMADSRFRAWTIYYELKESSGDDGHTIDEIDADQIVAWPNPVNNMLFLKNADDAMVTIYDSMGRLMLQQRYHNGLDVSHLAKGIYAVQVNGQTFRIVH